MKFSILIPSYNISEYLPRCLNSVLKQSYKEWEIILADDGSTDDSVDIIKQYATQNKQIKAFYQNQNRGIASIRNLMLEESTGDYIIFLDGDDCWKSEKSLEKIAAAICENNNDIIVFQHEIIRKDGSSEYRRNNTQFLSESKVYTGEEYLKNVLSRNRTYMWFPWLYAFRKNLWMENDIRFNPDLYACEDAEVIYQVILSASKIAVIYESVYQYQEERDGKLTRPSKKLLLSMLKATNNNIKEVERMDIGKDIKLLLKDNFSHSYYAVLFSINYLNKREAAEIWGCLNKNRSIMTYTKTSRYVFLAKVIRVFGLHITSRAWYVFSKCKNRICWHTSRG